MHKNRFFSILISVSIFLTLIFIPAFAHSEEIIDNDYGFSFDFPEGFYLEGSTNDGLTCLFANKKIPVNIVLKIYPDKTEAHSTLSETFSKLSANGDISDFIWYKKNCSFSIFEMQVPGDSEKSTGWALSTFIEKTNSTVVILTYSKEKFLAQSQPFFFTILNSIKIDSEDSIKSGPIVSFTFPVKNKYQISTKIQNTEINSFIYEEDIEASRFVIDTEYNVLKYYANDPKWKEAWCRYYRNIYKDTRGRIKNFTDDAYRILYKELKNQNSKNMSYDLNRMLLTWVQNFSYGREKNPNGADFSSIPEILTGSISDCDSRSILVSAMLNQIGVESVLFISNEYKHAVYGAFVKPEKTSESASIIIEDKAFLLNETTKKGIAPGLIAQEQSNTEKWIPVLFK